MADKGNYLIERRGFLKAAGGLAVTAPVLAACGAAGSTASTGGTAAKFPTRPINVIVPYGAGGGSDQLARASTPFAAKKLGVQMPVENVPGSNGSVGISKLLSAPADGYTISTYTADENASAVVGTASYKADQVVGVVRLMDVPSFYFVNSKSSWHSIESVIAYAKAHPGKLKLGTAGRFTLDEITTRFVEKKTGASFNLVPYSKPAERYQALLSGEIDVLYEQSGDVRQYINSGQYRPLVIFSKNPLPIPPLDKVPTSVSMGWDVEFHQYRGFVAKAGTPQNVLKDLGQAFTSYAQSEKYKTFSKEQYMYPDSFQTAAQFNKTLQDSRTTLQQFLKELGIKTQ